ncbi:unnamed protein product [Paramecium primaurelia]|uniref:Uncharacterized protein n=1 Tax=Paramecium primaurelia TaxID=5886 RepID=A0A8S1JQZ8_PARPR|nr:unnamed protein product [Paramecium primaurelia]
MESSLLAQNLKAYQLTKNNLVSYQRYKDNSIIEVLVTYNHLLQQYVNIQPTLGNHGFIPQTYRNQQDLIDILVFYLVEIGPISLVEAGVIEITHMIDFGEINDKINAVAKNDRIQKSRIFQKSKVSFEDYNQNLIVEIFKRKLDSQKFNKEKIKLYKNKFLNNL